MVKTRKNTASFSHNKKVIFSYDATCKISLICKILTFFEDLSFLNPRSHLKVLENKICEFPTRLTNNITFFQIKSKRFPLVYFVLQFFSNSSKFHATFLNLSGNNILDFFQNSKCLLQCQRFHNQALFFVRTSSIKKMNISLAILVVFESRGFEKIYSHFPNKTFPISSVIINLSNYIWGIGFIHKNT